MKATFRRDFLIFIFFFGSGFAALLYQIVWLKYLNLLFGSTTYATSAVLAAFMFGLSAGSWLAPKFQSLYRSPIRSYGLVEIGVGLFALLFIPIYHNLSIPFRWLFNLVGPQTFWYNTFTFLIAFVLLSIPTILMGASLPLLARWVIRDENVGKRTGLLYGMNTAGAVAGILASAFVLIPFLGLKATIHAGVVINLLIGLLCFVWGSRQISEVPARSAHSETERSDPLLWFYSASGLLAIGYEVLWTRILVLHFGSSVYAYAIMLSVFLLGISLGSYAGGKLIDRKLISPTALFGWIQTAWAFSILLQIWQFAHLSETLFYLIKPFPRITTTAHFLALFVGAFQILILPTFLSGMLFPAVVKQLWGRGLNAERSTSLAYSFNTVGGIFGSIIATFLLIPILGTQNTIVTFALINLLIGLAVLALSNISPRLKLASVFLAVMFAITAYAVNQNTQVLRSAGIFQMEGDEKLISLEEDVSATISVEERKYLRGTYRSLSVNGINVAGSSPSLVAIQKMQGNLPMILYGPAKSKEVLHIGFGSGGTAYSVSLYPNTKITVVELSRGIVRNADKNFRSENNGIVQSGKLEFIYFDGRSFLQNTDRKFDVILSDSIHPRYSGNGSLYTKDYYDLVYSRLRPGGVHSQWIPIYSVTLKNLKEILRAFREVMPETYVWYINSTINPYIVVTGIKERKGIEAGNIQQAMSIPTVQKDLASVGVMNEYHVLDYFLFGTNGIKNFTSVVEPHIDDLSSVEYESSKLINRQKSWFDNFQDLLNHIEPAGRYITDQQNVDSHAMMIYRAATTENLRGQLFYIAGKYDDAKAHFGKAIELNSADEDPYEYSRVGF